MSVTRCPIALKTVRFSIQESKNTFKYVCNPKSAMQSYKLFPNFTLLSSFFFIFAL